MEDNSTVNETDYIKAVYDKDVTFKMYGILTLLKCVMVLIQFYALLKFCQNASVKLHNAMTVGVVGATMSFFDTHFIGNILNRFSYDLNNIDEFIPFLFPGLGRVSMKYTTVLLMILIILNGLQYVTVELKNKINKYLPEILLILKQFY